MTLRHQNPEGFSEGVVSVGIEFQYVRKDDHIDAIRFHRKHACGSSKLRIKPGDSAGVYIDDAAMKNTALAEQVHLTQMSDLQQMIAE
jgi:hypothetical protein